MTREETRKTPKFNVGDTVMIKWLRKPGEVIAVFDEDNSYMVRTKNRDNELRIYRSPESDLRLPK